MAFDINKMKENQKIHETTVVGDLTVKAYLPYMEKIEFAADVQLRVLETDDKTGLSFVSFKEDLFLLYYALKYYTDLPEDADPVEVYDYMMSTGLWKQIYNEIQSDYCCTQMLYEAMRASALEVSHQAISLGQTMKDVMGFINSDDFVAAMTNMKLDTEQRLQAADLHKQTPNLLSFAKK